MQLSMPAILALTTLMDRVSSTPGLSFGGRLHSRGNAPMPRREAPETRADFYVSPTGSDAGPGTELSPFATLARAQAAVRTLGEGHVRKSDVTILVRGGT